MNNNNNEFQGYPYQPNYNYPVVDAHMNIPQHDTSVRTQENLLDTCNHSAEFIPVGQRMTNEPEQKMHAKQIGEQCNVSSENIPIGSRIQSQEYRIMDQPQMISIQQQYSYNPQMGYPPQAPPPAPEIYEVEPSALVIGSEQSKIDIRDIKSIEECRHSDTSKYLYISSPKIILSIIIMVFYVLGVISLIAASVILIIVLVAALSGGNGNNSDCNCNCDCNCLDLCLVCRCCENCLSNSSSTNMNIIAYSTIDYNYYRRPKYRRMAYSDYEVGIARQSSCSSCLNCLSDCFQCSCCDSFNLGNSKESCIISKVEVYCTNCNSKLKEEYQGTKHIVPSLVLGFFGIVLLIISIILLQKYV